MKVILKNRDKGNSFKIYIYIGFSFVNIFDDEVRKPHCTICRDILTNEAMKPSKFKWNFHTNHDK